MPTKYSVWRGAQIQPTHGHQSGGAGAMGNYAAKPGNINSAMIDNHYQHQNQRQMNNQQAFMQQQQQLQHNNINYHQTGNALPPPPPPHGRTRSQSPIRSSYSQQVGLVTGIQTMVLFC